MPLTALVFEIPRGEFCAIVGTSGSGKSTLLNMLAGLEKPTKGKIRIAGHQIEGFSEDRLVAFRREHVGFIFRAFHLLGTMNALENVALPLSFRGVPVRKRLEVADRMLDLVKLSGHKKASAESDVRRTAAAGGAWPELLRWIRRLFLPMSLRETWIRILPGK